MECRPLFEGLSVFVRVVRGGWSLLVWYLKLLVTVESKRWVCRLIRDQHEMVSDDYPRLSLDPP